MRRKRAYSAEEALARLRDHCSRQERCKSDLRMKLNEWQVERETGEQLLEQLEEEGFINEERFAEVFAGGKFRIKRWGPYKIRQALLEKYIPEEHIEQALQAISEKDRREMLRYWIDRKGGAAGSREARSKLVRFLTNKGFDMGMVLEELDRETG